MKAIARSARGTIGPQLLDRHHIEVHSIARKIVSRIRRYLPNDLHMTLKIHAAMAALYHDMGKYHKAGCQKVLTGKVRTRKMLDHTASGALYLFDAGYISAAIAARFHHWPLPDRPDKNRIFGENDLKPICDVYDYLSSSESCKDYHRRCLPDVIKSMEDDRKFKIRKCDPAHIRLKEAAHIRLLISILVAADRSSVARHEGRIPALVPELKPEDRLNRLCAYQHNLAVSRSGERTDRERIWQDVLVAPLVPAAHLNGTVGSGKTLASILYGLRHRPRKIIFVSPFITLIDQNANTLSKSILLPGENESLVIGRSHHEAVRAKHVDDWDCPIICTTAVQFYETLFSNEPNRLLKYQQIVGSFIILDEFHMLPPRLLALALYNIQILIKDFGCKFLFVSGTMIKPWEHSELCKVAGFTLPVQPLLSKDTERLSYAENAKRVTITIHPHILSLKGVCDLVGRPEYKGSKLIILNTLRNAAKIARELCRIYGRDRVEHLSTALTPKDRAKTLARILKRLANGEDFFLVATSCVECGQDFDFEHGFREKNGFNEAVQTSGRTNRSGTKFGSQLVIMQLDTKSEDFTKHNEFESRIEYFDDLCRKHGSDLGKSPDHANEYFNLMMSRLKADERSLVQSERDKYYEVVAERSRLIEDEKQLVVIEKYQKDIEAAGSTSRAIILNSVQVYGSDDTIRRKYDVEPSKFGDPSNPFWLWKGNYDDFLGILA